MTLHATPCDCLREILSYLNVTDLCRLSCSSKWLYRAANESDLLTRYRNGCEEVTSLECSTMLLCKDTRDALSLLKHLETCPRAKGWLFGHPHRRCRVGASAYVGDVEGLRSLLREPGGVPIACAMALHGGHVSVVKLLAEEHSAGADIVDRLRGDNEYRFGHVPGSIIEYLWREAGLDSVTAAELALLGEHYALLQGMADVDWNEVHDRVAMSTQLTRHTRLYCLKRGANNVSILHFLHPPCEPALEHYADKGIHSWRDLFTISCIQLCPESARLCLSRIDAREVGPVVDRTKETLDAWVETALGFVMRGQSVDAMLEWLESLRPAKRLKRQ